MANHQDTALDDSVQTKPSPQRALDLTSALLGYKKNMQEVDPNL